LLYLEGVAGGELEELLTAYGLRLERVPPLEPIPGSYWGDSEAGLRGATLYARPDTPVHSILHEASHYICMSSWRRERLERDAGGDDDEETAVCYLQVLLGEQVPSVGRERMFADMDAWGYSFRLGNTRAWFLGDAGEAREWLVRAGILASDGRLTWKLRSDPSR
jgi:hypothetical protein